MGDVSFPVELRDSRGKGAARELRRRGMVPGIVYGGGNEATAISLDALKFDQMIKASHAGLNTLIDLEGAAGAAGKTVIAKELQREAVRGGLTHVDLYEVDLTAKMEVMVPIHLTGTPAGVVLGGVLDQQQRELMLLCLPDAIPDEIAVDVSGLELGGSLHVSDLPVPAGSEVHTDDSLTIATVLVPRGLTDAEESGEAATDEGDPVAVEGEAAAEASDS